MDHKLYRPLVGIACGYDYEKNKIYLKDGYYDAIFQSGAMAVLIPPAKEGDALESIVERCDGVMITGGPDVDPKHYGESVFPANGEICPCRDDAEIRIIKKTLALDKPLLGICRGIQILNVAYQGTLYQDIFSQAKDKKLVAHSQKAPFWYPTHSIELEKESHIAKIFGKSQTRVNSWHHQAIKALAPGFKITAKAEDGIIEAIEHQEKKFVLGVQWHPEMMWQKDPESLKIFQYFIEYCQKEANVPNDKISFMRLI